MRWQVRPDFFLLAGVFAGDFDIIPKSTVPGRADTSGDVVSQGGSFVYFDPAGVTHSIQRVTEARYQTYAGYLELNWQITPRFKAIGGTRRHRRHADQRNARHPAGLADLRLKRRTDGQVHLHRGLRRPGARTYRASYDRGDVLAQPNPNLKPEKANSNEINLEYNKKNINLGLSGYYGRQSNLILVSDGNLAINQLGPVTVPDPSSITGVSSRELVQSVNGGSSRNYGAGFFTGEPPSARLRYPWASYSYVDFQRTLPDGTKTGLPGISRHNVRLGVTWAATPKLFITPSLVLHYHSGECGSRPLEG